MKNKPHGVAVIISNSIFHTNDPAIDALPTRRGSEIDEKKLCDLWKHFDYDIRVFSNYTAAEINNELLRIAKEDHTNHDSFILCLLSHGAHNIIFGTDGGVVKIDEIAKLFDHNSCPSLAGKPKVIIVQACREIDLEKIGNGKYGYLPCSPIPNEVDFLIAYSTPLGYPSWRSPQHGSVYIEVFCEVLMRNAHDHDLVSILTMVNNEVYKKCNQCPQPILQLRKKMFICSH